jgi:hypothetical protein
LSTNGAGNGAALVFTRSNGIWTQQSKHESTANGANFVERGRSLNDAALLGRYDVFPTTIHPTNAKSLRGYKCADIRAAITRLLPHDPHIAPWLHHG